MGKEADINCRGKYRRHVAALTRRGGIRYERMRKRSLRNVRNLNLGKLIICRS